MMIPELVHKTPAVPEEYEKIVTDGISIYVDKRTYETKPFMTLKLEKFLFVKRIVPHGINVNVL